MKQFPLFYITSVWCYNTPSIHPSIPFLLLIWGRLSSEMFSSSSWSQIVSIFSPISGQESEQAYLPKCQTIHLKTLFWPFSIRIWLKSLIWEMPQMAKSTFTVCWHKNPKHFSRKVSESGTLDKYVLVRSLGIHCPTSVTLSRRLAPFSSSTGHSTQTYNSNP